jgi:thiosulfate/3-mercaptopyruvate sulfurtransferase
MRAAFCEMKWDCRGVVLAAVFLVTGLMLCLYTQSSFAQAEAEEVPPIGDETFEIVSPEWVASHAGDPDVKILDVRTAVSEYQYGHVPNAVHLADKAMRVPKGGVPVQYLDADAMAAVFRRCGINQGDKVVVYSEGGDVLGATMVIYCLHRIGVENTMLMNGGFSTFKKTSALTQAYPEIKTGDLKAELDSSIFVTFEQLKEKLGSPDVAILDTRPVEDYLGNTNRWMRNGHIPGALNLDWHQMMRPDNHHKFKSVKEMRKIVDELGIDKEKEVILYCGTSREATLMYLLMKHVFDYPNVRLYEGSWTEYCSREKLPLIRGAKPGKYVE